MIIGLVIHATHDIAPYPEGQTTPTPFMYWDSIAPNAVYSEKAVATALIKRLVVVFMSSLFFFFSVPSGPCLQKPEGTRKQQNTSLSMQLQMLIFGFNDVPFLFNVLFNVLNNVLFNVLFNVLLMSYLMSYLMCYKTDTFYLSKWQWPITVLCVQWRQRGAG